MITATGIGSGLDIESLVTQLVQAESRPTELRIAREQSFLRTELSAFGTLKGSIAGFQNAVSQIKDISSFQKRSVVLSDGEAISVTVSNKAPTGNFSLEVSQLATTHSLASGSFNEITDVVGTGILTIKFGTTDYDSATDTYNSFTLNPDSKTLSVIIDGSNNTLEGIRDAINEANQGVSAVIINDGTGFRLLINSDKTGVENSLEVSVINDGDSNNTDNSGLSALTFNASATHLSQSVAAKDAQLKVNGLTVTSASNSVSTVIDGITLELKQLTEAPVTMAVSKDTASITTAINSFVNGFRAFNAVANQLSAFDKNSQTGNILIGDATLRTAVSRVRQVLNNPVDNFSSAFSTLSEIGITTDINGSLVIDSEKLNDMIENNFDAIAGLFAAFGQIADDDIEFMSSGSNTQPGEYDVNISQLATQGKFSGSGVLPDFASGSVTIDANNDTLVLEIDGVQGSTITLTQGVYTTGAALAQEIESRINGISEFVAAGIAVKVSFDSSGNSLSITSNQYGSAAKVNVTGIDSETAATLGFSVAAGIDGLDVVGTIGGIAATGVGRSLTGAADTDTEGLVLKVTGGNTGARAAIKFSRGIGDQLDTLLTDLLSTDGLLDTRTKGIDSSLKELDDDLVTHQLRMDAIEARFRAQFSALDALVAQLQATGSFLTAALASLPGSAPLR